MVNPARDWGTRPIGRFNAGNLGREYAVKLDKLAARWGCETLSEAALELLKDAIDEELKREKVDGEGCAGT